MSTTPTGKKIYEKPAVLHAEKLETRAVVCAKADETCMAPLQS